MTSQARSLLKKLKKCQKNEDGSVFINFVSFDITQVHYGDENYETGNITEFADSIHSLLAYLEKQDYITHDKHGIVKVLHAGWHATQDSFNRFLSFAFNSILVPILVSVATSVIILFVQAALTTPS